MLIYKTTSYSFADSLVKLKQENVNTNLTTDQQSRVEMGSSHDLPEQDNESERPYFAYERTSTVERVNT